MFKVIIADDEPIMRNGLKTLIDWRSIDCELLYCACDGFELQEKIEALKPDIVISDIKMPGPDGIAIAKYLYETKPEIKLILLTGYADFSYAKSAIQYKVTDYVTKTGALEGVLEAVEKAKREVGAERAEREAADAQMVREYLRAMLEESCNLPQPPLPASVGRSDLGLENYRVVSIEFLPNEKLKNTPQNKLMSGMTNFLGMSFRAFKHYILVLSPEEFCMIVCGAARETALNFHNICEDIVDTVTNFMNLKIMLGVSRRHSGAEMLHAACAESHGFLQRYFIDQSKNVYYADEWADAPKSGYQLNPVGHKELLHALRRGSRDRALAGYDGLMEELREGSMQDIKSAGIVLLSSCDSVLAPYLTDAKKLSGRQDLSSDILKCRLISEFDGILRALIAGTAEYVAGFVQNRNVVVMEADRYMEEHFCEDIELRDIADAIHVNPSYLSRTYREQTGKTVMTSLNERKIAKAKESLRYTNSKVYEVAESIGINDTTYFSHFFKKHTGLTPREFKERFQGRQED